jgi:hypothetical protein
MKTLTSVPSCSSSSVVGKLMASATASWIPAEGAGMPAEPLRRHAPGAPLPQALLPIKAVEDVGQGQGREVVDAVRGVVQQALSEERPKWGGEC